MYRLVSNVRFENAATLLQSVDFVRPSNTSFHASADVQTMPGKVYC